jgi:site-specific recombinase XerD
MKLAPEQGPIFDISYKRLHQVWQEWKPVNKKLHSLRHTFAMNLYKKSKDLRLVQTAMGHRSINSTMIYQEYEYTTQEYRKYL